MIPGAPQDRPAPPVHLCRRLGEIQTRLIRVACPAERQGLEAEMAEVLVSLETANTTASILRQPHV
jgi:hypothetical protein